MGDGPKVPPPRKCDTRACEHPPCLPDHDPEGIDQVGGGKPAWVFECPCGWKRIEPVK